MSFTSSVVITPGGGGGGGEAPKQKTSVTQSSSMQMQSSSNKSSSSSAHKTTTTTTSKSSKTVSKSTTTRTSSSAVSVKSSSQSFADNFGKQLGIDVDQEMKKLVDSTTEQAGLSEIRRNFLRLESLEHTASDSGTGGGGGGGGELIKLDSNSIMNYVDKSRNDMLNFNFDVNEYSSESVSVKTDGNKIEVHARKTAKQGDGQELSEEFHRTYEMPTSGALDPASVTSSVYKDGVLTVQVPLMQAIEPAK